MPSDHAIDEVFELERYELREEPRYRFELNRREFLGVVGAGLLITTTGAVTFAQRRRGRRRSSGARTVGARLHIGEDGVVSVFTGKVEVGQGSRTQLTMAAAEEMRLPVERIRLVMADTDLTPNDGGT
jgi:isoquinoline 1-oxidoreductase